VTPHGSYSTYTNGKCRCDECRRANAGYQRRARAARTARAASVKLPHGAYSTYVNWGCRCDECKAANARRSRQQRQVSA
jgi:hypothetical protein